VAIFFLFSTESRSALGPTQPPIKWLLDSLSAEVKRPRRKPDHSHLVSRSRMLELYFHSVIFSFTFSYSPKFFHSFSLNFLPPIHHPLINILRNITSYLSIYLSIHPSIYSSTFLVDLDSYVSFLIYRQPVRPL
jgi:hypothetical protein